jgi:hypothetical protein
VPQITPLPPPPPIFSDNATAATIFDFLLLYECIGAAFSQTTKNPLQPQTFFAIVQRPLPANRHLFNLRSTRQIRGRNIFRRYFVRITRFNENMGFGRTK